jgi:hypothetical protein
MSARVTRSGRAIRVRVPCDARRCSPPPGVLRHGVVRVLQGDRDSHLQHRGRGVVANNHGDSNDDDDDDGSLRDRRRAPSRQTRRERVQRRAAERRRFRTLRQSKRRYIDDGDDEDGAKGDDESDSDDGDGEVVVEDDDDDDDDNNNKNNNNDDDNDDDNDDGDDDDDDNDAKDKDSRGKEASGGNNAAGAGDDGAEDAGERPGRRAGKASARDAPSEADGDSGGRRLRSRGKGASTDGFEEGNMVRYNLRKSAPTMPYNFIPDIAVRVWWGTIARARRLRCYPACVVYACVQRDDHTSMRHRSSRRFFEESVRAAMGQCACARCNPAAVYGQGHRKTPSSSKKRHQVKFGSDSDSDSSRHGRPKKRPKDIPMSVPLRPPPCFALRAFRFPRACRDVDLLWSNCALPVVAGQSTCRHTPRTALTSTPLQSWRPSPGTTSVAWTSRFRCGGGHVVGVSAPTVALWTPRACVPGCCAGGEGNGVAAAAVPRAVRPLPLLAAARGAVLRTPWSVDCTRCCLTQCCCCCCSARVSLTRVVVCAGTGKTHIARALANACTADGHHVSFFMRKVCGCCVVAVVVIDAVNAAALHRCTAPRLRGRVLWLPGCRLPVEVRR